MNKEVFKIIYPCDLPIDLGNDMMCKHDPTVENKIIEYDDFILDFLGCYKCFKKKSVQMFIEKIEERKRCLLKY